MIDVPSSCEAPGRRRGKELGAAVKCAKCGQKTAKTSQYCVLCGAPVGRQRSTAAEPGTGGAGGAIAASQPPSARWEALPEAGDGNFAGWAEWARTQCFSVTRLRPGYEAEEVDSFLEAIGDTFLGVRQPPVTASDVRNKIFKTTRLRPGYDEEEVDAFLDQAERRLATRQRTAMDDAD
jgi:DivIVA domain-containing protein